MHVDEVNHLLLDRRAVTLPAGDHYLSGSIRVPSRATLRGEGPATRLVVDGPFPAIVFEEEGGPAFEAAVRDLSIAREPGAAWVGTDGIVVLGDAITVENVTVTNCFRNVAVGNQAVPCRDVTLRDVSASHTSPTMESSQYGLYAVNVNRLLVDNCRWTDAWLDGIKLAWNCTDVVVRGGSSSYNGTASNASGDGIDCFAGGSSVVIDGTVFEGNGVTNGGNGIVIKTAAGTDKQPSAGLPRQFVLRNVIARANRGAGIVVEGVYDHSSSRPDPIRTDLPAARLLNPSEDARSRAHCIVVDGCVLENNHLQGVFVNGFLTIVTNSVMRANERDGIRIGENARDVLVSDCMILGCSRGYPGRLPAVAVESGASRIRLHRVTMNGSERGDDVSIVTDDDYAAAPALHRNGIEVEAGVHDVTVEDCESTWTTSPVPVHPNLVLEPPVVSDQAPGEVLHLAHTGSAPDPNGWLPGSGGSTYRTSDPASLHPLWVKVGAAAGETWGWHPALLEWPA